MNNPAYNHTQRGKLHWILHTTSLFTLLITVLVTPREAATIVYLVTGFTIAIIEFFAFTCMTLRVYDDGDHLALKFGPLPLLAKRLPYQDMATTEPGRSKFIDGWGVHYIPGRGWTYNLWGFDCVEITMMDDKVIRVGTDDTDGLDTFLKQRIQET
ncbi:MAG: hypothetical protein GY917_01230 [Planctomycetaceae bacterium]|nr:hypothetical protein [Planctomycetaceae bacterium]